MMSAFFHFQRTLNRLFNNCITFYWSWISSSWNMKGVSNWPTASALSHQDPISLLCLLSLSFLHCFSSFFAFDRYIYHRNDFFCLILRCIMRNTCLGIVIEIYFLYLVNLIEFIYFCSFFTLVYLSFGFNPNLTPPVVFRKMYHLNGGWSLGFLWLLIILRHIFSENFIGFPEVVEKILRNSVSILANFHQILSIFWIFWHYLVTKKLMTSAYNRWGQHFFTFNHTLNRLFNNCIKLY